MIVGSYNLHLYCKNQEDEEKHKWGYYNLNPTENFPVEYSDEGPRSYYTTRRAARRDGWVFKRNGDCICPRCNGVNK